MANPKLIISSEDGDTRIRLSGEWSIACANQIAPLLERHYETGSGTIILDGSELGALDTVGAMFAIRYAREIAGVHQIRFESFSMERARIIEMVQDRLPTGKAPPQKRPLTVIQEIGKAAFDVQDAIKLLLSFIGETALGALRIFKNPRLFRVKELAVQLELIFVDSIPIVCLMTFLIGMVIAYLSSIQLLKFGANIFLVDGIGLTMCRELAPIIVAVIMAGRSGSAFTAQIGTMKLNEELDAMETMGLSPIHALVLPRVIALMIAMPLLVFIGDMVGIAGGAYVGDSYFGITFTTFIDRLHRVLLPRHFFVGLIKAPVFGLFIATIGCKMGLTVENNAQSVGLHTTSTVVQSIVVVILLNAGFAILFQKLGV